MDSRNTGNIQSKSLNLKASLQPTRRLRYFNKNDSQDEIKEPPFVNPVGPGQYNIREFLNIGNKTQIQFYQNSPQFSFPKQRYPNKDFKLNPNNQDQTNSSPEKSKNLQDLKQGKGLSYMQQQIQQKMSEINPQYEMKHEKSPACKFSKFKRPDLFPVPDHIKHAPHSVLSVSFDNSKSEQKGCSFARDKKFYDYIDQQHKQSKERQNLNQIGGSTATNSNDSQIWKTSSFYGSFYNTSVAGGASFGKEKRDKIRVYHPDFKYDNLNGETFSPGPAVYDPLQTLNSFSQSQISSFPKADRKLDPKFPSQNSTQSKKIHTVLPGPDRYYPEEAEKSVIIREPQPVMSKAKRNIDMRVFDAKNIVIIEKGLY
eukprot:403363049